MHFNNIVILDSLNILNNLLDSNNNISNIKSNLDFWIDYKVILGESINSNHNWASTVRIWKSKCFYTYYFDNMKQDNLYGCLDYII